MPTDHTLIIGSCTSLKELKDESIQLVVTSPPYFNAPFDYKELYKDYSAYLEMLQSAATELFRVVQDGRIVFLNIDDMLVDGEKYPIVADATKAFQAAGFRYRDRIMWKKPDGYLRISRRSGVLLQNPYPMYFYPDNLLESIIIFQKGRFNYRSIKPEIREASKIDLREFSDNKWFPTLWEITNVLPGAILEKNIAAFPDELAYRAVKLFSYVGETVLDPFCGSGTTLKVARSLERNSVGIELQSSLVQIIRQKVGFNGSQGGIFASNKDKFHLVVREE